MGDVGLRLLLLRSRIRDKMGAIDLSSLLGNRRVKRSIAMKKI